MNVQIAEIILGAVLPPFIDLVNKHVPNSTWRYLISLLVSLLAGVVLSWGDLSLAKILESGAIIFAAAQTVYKTYYQDSKLQTTIRK